MKIIEIPLGDILVPANRLRPVDEAHAQALSVSIEQGGLINPITVVKTPPATKKRKPYTLVAGAHRLRAHAILKLEAVPAIVTVAVGADAEIKEIEENLSRHDLNQLDRAIFINKRRALFERKNQQIQSGRKRSNIDQLELWSEKLTAFADQIDLSKSTLKTADFIGRKLTPELIARLRGTQAAKNQSLLVKLAKLEPKKQARVAVMLKNGHPVQDIVALLSNGGRKKNSQEIAYSAVAGNWARLSLKNKTRFMREIMGLSDKIITAALGRSGGDE